jgi:hypothetical protein
MRTPVRVMIPLLFVSSLFTNCKTTTDSEVKYETDQYSTQIYFAEFPIKDSSAVLNETINRGIQTVLERWTPGQNQDILPQKISEFLAKRQLEVWAIDNPNISSFLPGTEASIYRESEYLSKDIDDGLKKRSIWVRIPLFAAMKALRSPIITSKGLAANIQANGVEFGADKLTHFFDVGFGYYNKYRESIKKQLQEKKVNSLDSLPAEIRNEVDAAATRDAVTFGVETENGKWGKLTTGVFSNADLVANYQGFMWFKEVTSSTSAYIGWTKDGLPYQKKLFDLVDFVNDYWNEAMNPNEFSDNLQPFVTAALYKYCNIYSKFSGRFVSTKSQDLEDRFGTVGLSALSKRQRFRLDIVCEDFNKLPDAERVKYVQVQRSPDATPESLRGDTYGLSVRNAAGEYIENYEKIKAKILENSSPLPGCSQNLDSTLIEFAWIQEFHERLKNEAATKLKGKLSNSVSPIVLGERPVNNCIKFPVTGAGIRPEASINLEYCSDKDNNVRHRYIFKYADPFYKSIETMDSFFDALMDGEHEYVSSEGFFAFNNPLAYTYRGLPTHCRWY